MKFAGKLHQLRPRKNVCIYVITVSILPFFLLLLASDFLPYISSKQKSCRLNSINFKNVKLTIQQYLCRAAPYIKKQTGPAGKGNFPSRPCLVLYALLGLFKLQNIHTSQQIFFFPRHMFF